MRLATALGLVLVLGLPSAASAATWSTPPQQIDPEPEFEDWVDLRVAADGTAFAFGYRLDESIFDSVEVAVRPPGSAFGALTPPGASAVSTVGASIGDLELDAAGNAIMAWRGQDQQIHYARRSAGAAGAFGAEQEITASENVIRLDLAVNSGGAALITWAEEETGDPTEVHAAYRPAGTSTSFGTPGPVATSLEDERGLWVGPLAFLDPSGAAAVLLEFDNLTATPEPLKQATTSNAAATLPSSATPLGTANGTNASRHEQDWAQNATGDAVFVFREPVDPATVWASIRTPGGSFSAPVQIGSAWSESPSVAIAPSGRAVATFTTQPAAVCVDPQVRAAMVAERAPGGAFGSPTQVAPGLKAEGQVEPAIGAGDARMFWFNEATACNTPWASQVGKFTFAPAGGSLSAPASTPTGMKTLASSIDSKQALALDGSGNAVAVWNSESDRFKASFYGTSTGGGGGGGGGGGPTNPIVTPPAGNVTPPSNVFQVGKAKASTSNGSVTVTLTAPGPGVFQLSAESVSAFASKKKRKKKIAIARKTVTAAKAGKVTAKLKASKKARKVLKKKGRLKAKLKITFTPKGGTPKVSTKTITFKLKKRKK